MSAIWAEGSAVLTMRPQGNLIKLINFFQFVSCCFIGLYVVKKSFNLFFVPLYCQKTEWREFIPLWPGR